MSIPAIVTAGDTRAAKAVYGESKVFLSIHERPLVAHVVATLQRVPEISEVWVVGNRERLEGVFADPPIRAELRKPLHLVAQRRNLMENCWETYRCIISGDPERGRDPVGAECDQEVLYLSGDLPFATPQEISVFIQRSRATGCHYGIGLVTQESLLAFAPGPGATPGIEVAYFNLREGRLRQSNLHYAKPGRLGNLHRIEDMYEHRHQRQFWNMLVMAWKLTFSKAGGPRIVLLYCIMHLAGLFDRWRLRRLADWLRGFVTLEANERVVGDVLDCRARFIVTEAGGCGIDIDTEHEFDVARLRYDELVKAQQQRATELYGPLPLPESAGGAPEVEDRV